ncbi:hypothetical protein QBC37DRAFT_300915 [Rhypophila decipiens]|uniref:DUF1996 domain-containing protein n=1 Tax=Rhypophila decipiens TaxID=261697 RepID=A0AAN6XTM9_9PEZI|nr:hypothetical protein QBC37DRAFT_300915 [Rhypophila decipiens]
MLPAASLRTPPLKTGALNLDPYQDVIQPTQITCPRNNFDPPSWPVGSNGSTAGIQDPSNRASGIGFPFQECDAYVSPLRVDIQFPSCYNPAAGLTNYKDNMQFPASLPGGKQNCPEGWIHTPQLLYEVYWDTPKFLGRWDINGNSQPFVWANGNRTGFSAHGDFIAGWDTTVLQQIIDNCDTGHNGMDKCPGLLSAINPSSSTCNIRHAGV